jgi:lipopolysaccharide transport system permease protein
MLSQVQLLALYIRFVQTSEILDKPVAAASPAQGDNTGWTEVIQPHTSLLDLGLADVWRYRDLVMLFVRRDFVSTYKQTVLGPIWFFIQPLLTTITYVIIFGNVAKLSTEGVPMMVFYMSGITIWNYFALTLTNTSTVFRDNATMFGKVYFPRLTMPLSIVISNLVRFAIQFGLFITIWLYYLLKGNSNIHPNWLIALTPLLVVVMGLMSLGLGMIFSALTTKYRDLAMLLVFGVQLLMYATPVIYPLSSITGKYRWLIQANPMTSIVETFRYAFLGSGTFSWSSLSYSIAFTLTILLLGTIIFNRVQKSFTDTV